MSAWSKLVGSTTRVVRTRGAGGAFSCDSIAATSPPGSRRHRCGSHREHLDGAAHGADDDWVRNVLAAGGYTLETRGRRVRLSRPRLVRHERREAVPRVLRAAGALDNVSDLLELTREPSSAR